MEVGGRKEGGEAMMLQKNDRCGRAGWYGCWQDLGERKEQGAQGHACWCSCPSAAPW
jgi:hypothetical protein